MDVLALLRKRFMNALSELEIDDASLAELILPSQDSRFGDYQANCAMPLGKRLGQPARDVAAAIVDHLDISDCCDRPEVAGPGFINLKLREEWINAQLQYANEDEERLGVPPTDTPQTIVLDYSSPNVAKPMHVGHIRSTVIGDALYRILSFLGHETISDNHLGDWGTQFGMIIFGYQHFVDSAALAENGVQELGRLYKLVNQLVEYHDIRNNKLGRLEDEIKEVAERTAECDQLPPASNKKEQKRQQKKRQQLQSQFQELTAQRDQLQSAIAAVEDDQQLAALAVEYPDISERVLAETALLHAGDVTNRELWHKFLPPCLEEIEETYRRLGVRFDHTLGESHYQDRLAGVVQSLQSTGIASESDGAVCVFFADQPTPMIVQKKDGAYLYATTDLATVQYRWETFRPDAILYVVDHRQSLHFQQLFDTVRRWGLDQIDLHHVSFGTVLGEDGKPFKTRSGSAVGLRGLLDESVERALTIVSQNDDQRPTPLLSDEQRRQVADIVGIGAIKYADLSHNRTSDYVFNYDKMLAMNGNTAAYLQYSYARVQSIFERGRVDVATLRASDVTLTLTHPAERALSIALIRFAESLGRVAHDLRPNHLTSYLFELAGRFAEFFEQCPVLKAEGDSVRLSRLRLCDLTARTIALGLDLLGIRVSERM